MLLSKMVGIETPESDIQEFNGQQTYIVERFDRRIENGMPVRLPMEVRQTGGGVATLSGLQRGCR